MDGIKLFNTAIRENIVENTKYLSGRPGYILPFAKLTKSLVTQENKRVAIRKEENVVVPPIMIVSVTNDCNLACEGCYANAQDRDRSEEMSIEDIERITDQAYEMGVGIVMFAGGEPLMKKGLLDIIEKYPKLVFVIFTNGLLIESTMQSRIKKLKNMITVFSLEGDKLTTDSRRGTGVYDGVMSVMKGMEDEKILFGTSITVTRNNVDFVLDDTYLQSIESAGCRAMFLIEYVPCNGDKDLCLRDAQKDMLIKRIEEMKRDYSMLPVALPGDESEFEGCLAAGRGFIHISSTGSVEACTFAPYSDVNIKKNHLKETLKSLLLTEIRLNHHLLEESEGGCALFENPEWVEGLIKKQTKRTCNSFL